MSNQPGPRDAPRRLSSGCVVLFTGLCASGKSTIAAQVYNHLNDRGCPVELLDGDKMRQHLNKNLGFTREDRIENVRRIAYVANMLANHGIVSLMAVIAPYRSLRAEVRRMSRSYLEVFVNAPLELCESRDPKGLYARARAGLLADFTGIDDVYEAPDAPDVECMTDREDVCTCADKVMQKLVLTLGWKPEDGGYAGA